MNSRQALLRQLPSVDSLLQTAPLRAAVADFGRDEVKQHVRQVLADWRDALQKGDNDAALDLPKDKLLDLLSQRVLHTLQLSAAPVLRPVINLTGTVLHTNLGRARLPDQACQVLQSLGGQACNLEYDLETGKRGDRDSHLQQELCRLTGAQAVTVVNNNAAAVLLVLNTLARDKEVLISRGELVEIGGSFRIPAVMEAAQACLHEVGTTNRTHLQDYREAINAATGLLMKVHTSNYAVQGFTASVSEQDLASLAAERDLPFVSDLGSGTLIELQRFGLPPEPTVRSVLEAGADIVTFSGDKLLGGVQAGIIAGRADLIQRIKANPLKRALRVDKLTLAALLEVLKLYRDPERLPENLPFLRDVSRSESSIREQAQQLLPALRENLGPDVLIELRETRSQVGSGALPLDLLPSAALVIRPEPKAGGADAALTKLAAAFRQLSTPVIGRIHDGEFWLDLRCLDDSQALLDLLPELAAQA
jgi:L-seryl-tRNA(Ser) seleniumtransferase